MKMYRVSKELIMANVPQALYDLLEDYLEDGTDYDEKVLFVSTGLKDEFRELIDEMEEMEEITPDEKQELLNFVNSLNEGEQYVIVNG